MGWVKISDKTVKTLLECIGRYRYSSVYNKSKKIIQANFFDDSIEIKVRHSVHLDFLESDFSFVDLDFANHVVISIKSGIAAVAFYENRELSDHKVFRAYMVRKKQGKSQIKYFKTKGKSRAGSRVRLEETIDFFEKINVRLKDYFEEHRVDLIAFNCSPTLFPYFFQSKISPPFEKTDARIFKIPVHIPDATFENLKKAYQSIGTSKVWIDESNQEWFDSFLDSNETKPDKAEEEDW